MIKKSTILTLLLLIAARCSFAQTYPVSASTQIIPPYSTFLADYVAPGSNRLALNIFLGDVNRPELRVKLKLSIIGQGIRIETKPEYLPPALILQGGVPERLIASDLAEYFRPENLNFQGITRQQFQRTGQLPEGLYQFCFEVLEYNRSVKISNSACAIAWLILNDPPVVNIPRNGEKLRIQDPQYVTFQWTPRHTGSPNSAFSTEYEFSLVEIWPESRNPNDAILTSPPIYTTTTQSTTLIYGPAETPLVPGRHYAFRIRAKGISGFDELDLFKNQGYSQTYSFIYGDACTLPQNIAAEVINSAKFKVKWQSNFNHTNFTVRYREANANSQWYQEESFFEDKEIRDLKEETKYEFQVLAGCGPFVSEYSPIASITTASPPEIEYNCGLPLEDFQLGSNIPLPSLKKNDVIYAGDFDVKITETRGSLGTFTGKGTVQVPYLDNLVVSVEFSGISVDTTYRMTAGFMNVKGIGVDVLSDNVTDFIDKLDESLASIDDVLGDISDGLDLADEILGEVSELANDIMDNGPFTTEEEIKLEGNSVEEYLEKAKQAIKDASNALSGGATVESIAIAARKVAQATVLKKRANKLKDIYANSDTIKVQAVEFYANLSGVGEAKYGFDKKEHGPHRLHYNIMVLPDNQTIPVPWAAAKAGEQIQVKVKWLSDSGVPAENIIFRSGSDGETLSTGRSGNEWTIILPQISNGQTLVINAVDDVTKETVGKLNAIGYNPLPRKVHIIPVGATRANFTKEELTSSLNQVYAQALADWEVTLEPAIQVEDYTGTLQDDEQALVSTYSDGMKSIIKSYKATEGITIIDNEFYLFLVDKSQTGKSGYMPRKHQFGFIYMGESGDTQRTIAHELGHGAFRLQHTFEEYPTIDVQTNNLMDYGSGTQLRKYQWDLIHNPPIVIGLVEDLDEGALAFTDQLVPPLTVYYSDDSFLITMKRKELTSSIILEIEYKGQAGIKSESTLGILDKKREIEIFKTNHSAQSEYYKINSDHIGYRIISNLNERNDLLGHATSEFVENNIKYRRHDFIIFPDVSATIILIDPATPFSDKVVINNIELQMNTSINNVLPDQISDVVLTSASIEIPANKILYVNPDCHFLATKADTRATFTLKHNGFIITFQPALKIEVNYVAVPNVFWESTSYSFSTQSVSHKVHENVYFVGIAKSQVINSLNEYFQILLKNSIIGTNGYDPFKDDNLQFSIDQLKSNLNEDGKNNIYVPCTEDTNLDINELNNPILSSTFYFSGNQNYLTDEGTGVTLKSDIPITISFAFDGTLGKIISLDQIKIKNITMVGSSAIVLVYKNKPQVLLENIVILPGGKILVNDTKLVGDLGEIQNLEQKTVGLLKSLLALAIYKKTGVMPTGSSSLLTSNTLTGSAVEVALESAMKQAIIDQIRSNNKILLEILGDRIPEDQKQGLDLISIMGIKE